MKIKRIAALLCSLVTAVLFGCSGAVPLSFTKPWVNSSSGEAYEKTTYEITQTDGEGTTELARGEMSYTLDTVLDGETENFRLDTVMSMTYHSIDAVPEEKRGKTNATSSSVVFGASVNNIMRPIRVEKTRTYETDSKLDFHFVGIYKDGLSVTYDFKDKKDQTMTFPQKKITSTTFDNEQLMLLVRSAASSSFKTGGSFKYSVTSITDSIYNDNTPTVFSINTTIAVDYSVVAAHKDFISDIVEGEENNRTVSCYKATLSLPGAMSGFTRGPSIDTYFAVKQGTGNAQQRLPVKYVEHEKDMQGNLVSITNYLLKSVTNVKA